ncbi:MAG TPA: 2-oxo acid dehydrogenase subunit E2 [Ktedonobacteraceae bacterium]|nr:2-oxo acid dehydrogenase subunit E2 [Ktedonobacteraceae bacterium]
MATDVILPALGMSQDTGKIVQWLKAEGQHVTKGEPLVEIETDKATVEIEAPADGVLARVSAAAGEDIPVGQVIAAILAPGEIDRQADTGADAINRVPTMGVSPLASRIAAEHNVDLSQIKSSGKRIQKDDVLSYLENRGNTNTNVGTRLIASAPIASAPNAGTPDASAPDASATARLTMASPKARRLAFEQGKDLATIKGSGPEGAVLAADVLAAATQAPLMPVALAEDVLVAIPAAMANGATESDVAVSTIWRIMAERTTQGWTSTPHFYLMREVNASRLISWRAQVLKRSAEKVTFTDLLVKIVAAALQMHPRVNASWHEGKITLKQAVNVGLAVAVEEGLVVPVISRADTLGLSDIARQRMELVAKAQAGKLRPQDISDGTFTISNLGMYNVDAFSAIINAPQAAILAVGRIAERVVPVNGQPAVQPMMVLTLSCDHRAVDGARGAQFLDTIATFIEEPLGLLA